MKDPENGEDDKNYYSMMKVLGERSYLLISGDSAMKCKNFDKLNFETWCSK
jgi:hypothetical protein